MTKPRSGESRRPSDIDCSSLMPSTPGTRPCSNLPFRIWSDRDDEQCAPRPAARTTQTGHPIAVFGPQTAYFIPQLLVEKDVHGPGIDARGAAFARHRIYVQLGRGRFYAWSATSASGDNIDEFVLLLCEPGGGRAVGGLARLSA